MSAELALALPALVAVLALCLTGLGLAVDQIRCVDAVRELALQVAPDGATAEVDVSADRVRVTVSVPARTRYLPALPGARASVEAALEPAARMGSP